MKDAEYNQSWKSQIFAREFTQLNATDLTWLIRENESKSVQTKFFG